MPDANSGATAQVMGDPMSAQILDQYRERHGKAPARLGCSLVAHRDLGFCAACHEHGSSGELSGWRLLAMSERGIPRQPHEHGPVQSTSHERSPSARP